MEIFSEKKKSILKKFRANVLKQDMWINFIPKFIEIYLRRHVGAHPDGHQHGGRNPTETSVIEFCYKRVNLSPEELKNIKIILFPKHELFV